MIATEDYTIELNEGETAELIRRSNGRVVSLAFGISGCALKWMQGEPPPWAVQELAKMRGVDEENTNGAGI